MKINKYIDHTLLKNLGSYAAFDQLAQEAKDYNFYTVCIPPSLVPYFKKNHSSLKLCSVAGFPLGYNLIETKISEIKSLFSSGCDEVDVVLNINAVKNAHWDNIENEFIEYSKISKTQTLKVIIESGELTAEEIEKICQIALKHPVSFLKTSTGFASKHADLKDVALIKSIVGDKILIKASGGIKNFAQASAFIEAGANRLGCSASVAIVTSGEGTNEY